MSVQRERFATLTGTIKSRYNLNWFHISFQFFFTNELLSKFDFLWQYFQMIFQLYVTNKIPFGHLVSAPSHLSRFEFHKSNEILELENNFQDWEKRYFMLELAFSHTQISWVFLLLVCLLYGNLFKRLL